MRDPGTSVLVAAIASFASEAGLGRGGIRRGMRTSPVASDVVSELGQDLLVAFVSAVQGAERDRLVHMAEHPDWYGTLPAATRGLVSP